MKDHLGWFAPFFSAAMNSIDANVNGSGEDLKVRGGGVREALGGGAAEPSPLPRPRLQATGVLAPPPLTPRRPVPPACTPQVGKRRRASGTRWQDRMATQAEVYFPEDSGSEDYYLVPPERALVPVTASPSSRASLGSYDR
jgi:hypothetical protein